MEKKTNTALAEDGATSELDKIKELHQRWQKLKKSPDYDGNDAREIKEDAQKALCRMISSDCNWLLPNIDRDCNRKNIRRSLYFAKDLDNDHSIVFMPTHLLDILSNALKALDVGEVLPILMPADKKGKKKAYTQSKRKLKAFHLLRYYQGEGNTLEAAKTMVSKKLGISIATIEDIYAEYPKEIAWEAVCYGAKNAEKDLDYIIRHFRLSKDALNNRRVTCIWNALWGKNF